MKTLTNSVMNDIHKRMIFRLVWERKIMSRTGIRTALGLSKSTISEIVRDLLEDGLVSEDGWEGKTGGRKRELLRVNPHGPKVMSILLRDFGAIEGALINLEGKVVKRITTMLTAQNDVRAAVTTLLTVIRGLWPPRERVLGIGLGVPGIVDHRQGVIVYSAHFHWQNVPLKDYLMRELNEDVTIAVDNRTISATLGEKWFGSGEGTCNLICLNCGEAVGAGIIMNGEIYRGGKDGAGEVGHITLEPSRRPCFCGKRGCLESLVALPALLDELGEDYSGEACASTLLQSRFKEERVRSLLERAFSLLGELVVILVHLFVPEKILFTGELVRVSPALLLEKVREKLEEKALRPLWETVELSCSPFSREEEVLWGAALVLENLFRVPNFHSLV